METGQDQGWWNQIRVKVGGIRSGYHWEQKSTFTWVLQRYARHLTAVKYTLLSDQWHFSSLPQVLESMQSRLKTVLAHPDLKKHLHEAAIKGEMMCLLECLCGVAEATTIASVALLFSYLHPALQHCVQILGMRKRPHSNVTEKSWPMVTHIVLSLPIMRLGGKLMCLQFPLTTTLFFWLPDLYHSYQEIVQLILDVFNAVASRQVCYLGQVGWNAGDDAAWWS